MKYLFVSIFSIVLCLYSCQSNESKLSGVRVLPELSPDNYNVAFLIMDGVYNTELTAPFDIFQHTQYRDGIKAMNTFLVANTLEPIRTFEGIRILPDFDYTQDDLPPIDILVVPSAEHHLDTDLENVEMINWVKKVGTSATYITSHCDGAFVLATAGLLDDYVSTTFPSDVDKYKSTFPHLKVEDNVLFVHDDRAITSAGGAKSFEAALYLCQLLYGPDIAKSIAKGLVIDWELSEIDYYSPTQSSQEIKVLEVAPEISTFDKAILVM